jgi:hypothetical protein
MGDSRTMVTPMSSSQSRAASLRCVDTNTPKTYCRKPAFTDSFTVLQLPEWSLAAEFSTSVAPSSERSSFPVTSSASSPLHR